MTVSSARSIPLSRLVKGFTLIEMIATISVLAVVSAVTVPALNGVNNSSSLNVGAREFANLVTQARSEAIARHNVIRLAVETKNGDANSALRRVSLWEWNEDTQNFIQLTAWQELAQGLIYEKDSPSYIRDSAYAQADGGSVRGDFVVDTTSSTEASFEPLAIASKMRVIEFLPSGAVRVPGANSRNAIFVIAPGFSDGTGAVTRVGGAVNNWAQINVDTLTGRVRIYRP